MAESSEKLDLDDSPRDALAAFEKAKARAGVDIADLTELPELQEAEQIYASLWTKDGDRSIMPVEILRVFAHTGNYVVGAYADNQMVGALAGLLGQKNGQTYLHSHILGVLAGWQGRSLGFVLKQHQRAWCLARGLTTVTWTFDPLVSRNAYFNLTKLGADAAEYLPNFYGHMTDEINAGDDSDRLLIEWNLESTKAVSASIGEVTEPDLEQLESAGAVIALSEKNGKPVKNEPPREATVILCRVPPDIVSLRSKEPQIAAAWRVGLRETLGDALEHGYRVTGVTRSGWYVLRLL